MIHDHCSDCFLVNCLETSACPLIYCSNGCSARMHECKRTDHENICPNSVISCLNVNYGCPSKIRRAELTRHLRICPASIVVCTFDYHHDFFVQNFQELKQENFLKKIAQRDQIWCEHMNKFNETRRISSHESNQQKQSNDKLIRSDKYPYITMPECMLSRGDGVYCSACRIHLRQLEDEEDQRLAQLSDEDRQATEHLYPTTNQTIITPSLVQMSTTLITSSTLSTPTPQPISSQSIENEPLPIINDIQMPYSYLYRLKFFSSEDYSRTLTTINPSPRFACLALCRRDEIEAHYLIHFHVDCILNTSFIQSCPKWQYGCTFQSERVEPCQSNGQSVQIRFDELNDAIAFQWYPISSEQFNQQCPLLDLPSEILEKILLQLDSLSLRNVSLVCHVRN